MVYQNRLGMFVHWGIYALTGLQDQAVIRYEMDQKKYEMLRHSFNPALYNPEAWVLLAKEAGMKYICFTTKHHDGFCMWNTKYTDYNVMNTPYGKDVLKMLADACAKHGMKLSLYYSNPDWNYEYGYNPASSHQWCAVQKERVDTERYREYIKHQVTELLTGYGPIYTFFWDIPPKIEDPSLNELIRKLQPGILINDRGWSKGDFSTPERSYQDIENQPFSRMVEACNSLGEQSWGYRAEEDFFTKRHICSSIDRIMALGGSYLLNVGPDARGVITPPYADRIRKVGIWYRSMEGCLESAEVDDFDYHIINNPCIATKKNGKTYLHFYQGLISSAVSLKHYPALPKRVRLLNMGKDLPFGIDRLPEFAKNGVGQFYLHIHDIPSDDLANEPIVIEIEW